MARDEMRREGRDERRREETMRETIDERRETRGDESGREETRGGDTREERGRVVTEAELFEAPRQGVTPGGRKEWVGTAKAIQLLLIQETA